MTLTPTVFRTLETHLLDLMQHQVSSLCHTGTSPGKW